LKTNTAQKIRKIESQESRTCVIGHPSQRSTRNTGVVEAIARRSVGPTMAGMRNGSAMFSECEAKSRFKISRAV
jgi:hypothetical protein